MDDKKRYKILCVIIIYSVIKISGTNRELFFEMYMKMKLHCPFSALYWITLIKNVFRSTRGIKKTSKRSTQNISKYFICMHTPTPKHP